MPTGAAHRFSDLESGNMAEDELNSLDSGANVWAEGPGSLNVAVSAGRYTTSGGIVDFPGSASLSLAASTLAQQIYLTVPGNVLTVGVFPGGEHMPLAECDTSGVEVIAIRDKRPRMTSALSPTAPGDVTGPGASANSAIAIFDGLTGKLLKDSSGVVSTGPGALNSLDLAAANTKLSGIAPGANVNPAAATNGEVTTGTEPAARLVSPAQLKLAAETHAPGKTRSLWTPAHGNDVFGAYRGLQLGASDTGEFAFMVPADLASLTSAKLIGIVQAGAALGGRDIDLLTQFAAVGELFNFNGAVDSSTVYDFSAGTNNLVEIDFTALLAGAAPGDFGGLQVIHNAIGGAVIYLGTVLTYSVG